MLPARTDVATVGASPEVQGRRARRGDPGIYEPEPGERIKVARLSGRFRFVRYGEDKGGEYAVVVGGIAGHELERCVTVDRVKSVKRRVRSARQATSGMRT